MNPLLSMQFAATGYSIFQRLTVGMVGARVSLTGVRKDAPPFVDRRTAPSVENRPPLPLVTVLPLVVEPNFVKYKTCCIQKVLPRDWFPWNASTVGQPSYLRNGKESVGPPGGAGIPPLALFHTVGGPDRVDTVR